MCYRVVQLNTACAVKCVTIKVLQECILGQRCGQHWHKSLQVLEGKAEIFAVRCAINKDAVTLSNTVLKRLRKWLVAHLWRRRSTVNGQTHLSNNAKVGRCESCQNAVEQLTHSTPSNVGFRGPH